MASAKSLEEMLSSEVDERAVTAFMRSLDPQLSSTYQDGNLVTKLKQEPSTMTTNNSFCINNTSSLNDNVMVTLTGAIPASGYLSQVASPRPTLVKNVTLDSDCTKLVYAPLTNVAPLSNVLENRTVIQRNTNHVANGNISGQPTASLSSTAASQVNPVPAQSPMMVSNPVLMQQHPMILTNEYQSPINGSIKQMVSDAQESKAQQKLPESILTCYGKPGTNLTALVNSMQHVPIKSEPMSQPTLGVTQVSVANIVQPTKAVNVVTQVVSSANMLPPGVQILNMCPGTMATTQKTLAPKVVYSNLCNPVRIAAAPQVITRPRAPLQNAITLPQGLVRSTLFVRTENGQLQLVNVAPPGLAPAGSFPTAANYRFESVQPGVHPAVTSSILQSNQSGLNIGTSLPPSANAQPQPKQKPTIVGNLSQPLSIQTTTANGQISSSPSQMSPTTAKKKCKNFLSTLLRLAGSQTEQVAFNVKNLIQGLIDGNIQPENFSHQLQKELKSSPQPYLIPFLKKNLPQLRLSLMMGELTIEGIRPPLPGTMPLSATSTQVIQMKSVHQPPQVRVVAPSLPSGSLAAQLASPSPTVIGQRLVTPKLPNMSGVKTVTTSKCLTGLLNQSIKLIAPKISTSISSKEKDREKKSFSSLRDDDDINDVAAMGGVNLIEESQRILATTAEIVGTQIRSCKDETFFSAGLLHRRVAKLASKYGIEDVSNDVVALISHAAQERLKSLAERLGTVAAHYVPNPKLDPRYEVTSDVKEQLIFLEELDRFRKRKRAENESEILTHPSNTKLNSCDQEQINSKQREKEIWLDRMREERMKETNLTALLAIGPRKRLKTDHQSNSIQNQVKRVSLRDLQFVMEQERDMCHSSLLYKSYTK